MLFERHPVWHKKEDLSDTPEDSETAEESTCTRTTDHSGDMTTTNYEAAQLGLSVNRVVSSQVESADQEILFFSP